MTKSRPAAGWNPRWLNCARVHGVEATEITAFGFIIWNGERLREWRKLHGVPIDAPLSDAQHAEYDAWLDAYPVNEAAS